MSWSKKILFDINEINRFVERSAQVQRLILIADRSGFAPDFPDFDIENLIPFLEEAKVKDLKNIEEFIDDDELDLINFFKEIRSKIAIKWSASPAFLCILLLIRKFPGLFGLDFLVSNGFNEDHAKIVLTALTRQLHG